MACLECGLKWQCLCSAVPSLTGPLALSLLMHEMNINVRPIRVAGWLKPCPIAQTISGSDARRPLPCSNASMIQAITRC